MQAIWEIIWKYMVDKSQTNVANAPAYMTNSQGYTSLPKPDEREYGQMVSKKVYLTYFDVYLSQLMWNHTKKLMEGLKQPTSVFLHWEVTDWQELFAKNAENKGN